MAVAHTVSVFGCSADEVRARLAPLIEPGRVVMEVALDFPVIYVKLVADGIGRAQAERLRDLMHERLQPFVYATDRRSLAEVVVSQLSASGLRLATAESCTGGRVAALVTAVPGASAVFELGLITYADAQKRDLLGVPAETLAAHGAVSPQVALAMAEGARRLAGADVAVAVTGIAGPDGGSAAKPVGTVHFGLADARATVHECRHFTGTRERVQLLAATSALDLVRRRIATQAT